MHNSSIREALLAQTPIGTTLAEVCRLLERRGWLVQCNVGNAGFFRQDFATKNDLAGRFSLQGNIGDYGPMRISAFWSFDSNNLLINIGVLRILDVSLGNSRSFDYIL